MKLQEVKFKYKGKSHHFILSTNMNTKILSIAVESWIIRTDNVSADSFCEYVNEKYSGHECNNAKVI